MTSEYVEWPRYFRLRLPQDWTAETEAGLITLFHPEGLGALQFSFARKRPAASDPNLLEKMAATLSGLKVTNMLGPTSSEIGGYPAVSVEYDIDAEFWRRWLAFTGTFLVLITYNCSSEDRAVERSAVDEVLASILWYR